MSKYITVTRDGRVAAPVYGGLVERGTWVRGPLPSPGYSRHPATRYASTPGIHPIIPHQNNKHAFHAKTNILLFPSNTAYLSESPREKDARQWRDLFGGGSLKAAIAQEERRTRRSGRGEKAGGWIPWRSREALLMPRGQRDERTLGKRRPVDLYLSSSRLATHRVIKWRKTLIRSRKAHAAM